MVLTYRRVDGSEQKRVAAYGLGAFFPGVEPGGFFFISLTQALSYLYDFTPDARLIWAASDRLRVFIHQSGVDEILFEAEEQALPYQAAEIAAMEERQASLEPPLFMNVPHHYQLIQHLVVDDAGDVWLYITSQERTGLLRLSATGSEQGFYPVAADFDVTSARVTVANGSLHVMVPGRESTAIHRAELP
jgi:hypothetical protein